MGVSREPSRFLQLLATRLPDWLNAPTAAQARFLSRLTERISVKGRDSEIQAALALAQTAQGDAAAFAIMLGLSRGKIEMRDRAERIRDAAPLVARDTARPVWIRVLALETAMAIHPRAASAALDALASIEPMELQFAAARGLANVGDAATFDTLLNRWDSYALATRRTLLGVLVATPATASHLLDAVENEQISASEIDPSVRDALRSFSDPKIKARIDVLLRNQASDRRAVVQRLSQSLPIKANAARGPALFAAHCQTCHARDGQGSKVGPDLLSVAGRPADDLLVAILDPAREAAPDGLGVVVVTTRGQTLTGLLAEETPAAVRLKRAGGLEDVIPRVEIEALRPTGRSLMPDGFEQILSPQDLADLIAFLRTPPRISP